MYVDITQCLPNDDYTICIYFHYQRGLEVIGWVCFSYLNRINYIRSLGQGSCQCWFSLIFFFTYKKKKKNSGKVSICTSSQHKKDANIFLKLVQYTETEKCWNCTTFALFGIHWQMLTDGTRGHSTSFYRNVSLCFASLWDR